MISRRSIRIKVMQFIYAFERSEGVPLQTFEKQVIQSIDSFEAVYLYQLYAILEIANEIERIAEVKATKHLPTEEDRKFSTKILSNCIIQVLYNDEDFRKRCKKLNFQHLKDDSLIKKLMHELLATDAYKDYVDSESEFNSTDDIAVLRSLFNEVMLGNELWIQHLEDLWPWCGDDLESLDLAVNQTIKKSKNQLWLIWDRATYDDKMKELKDFALELFREVVGNAENHTAIISDKLMNWESERLAVMDVLLMRMAIAELMNFPTIPVKVSINEYVDIAKEYSTPKSNEFINGILDKIMRELKSKGLINKEGRGLKEE